MLFLMGLLMSLSSPVEAAPPADVIERLNESFVAEARVEEIETGASFRGCALTDLRFSGIDPVTRGPGAIQARVYRAVRAPDLADLRTVIILPPTGGENSLDRWYSNTLCMAGFQVVLLQSWSFQTDMKLDLAMHDEGAVRALSAIRHVLDYVKPLRATQVGILGTSVGALSSALALGFDHRLSAAVLIVGGADQAEIIALSTESGVSRLRAERMKQLGYRSTSEYLKALREAVRINPVDFVDFTGPKKVLAFVGTKDTTVPTRNQRALVQALQAQSVEFEGDHTATILNTAVWEKGRITRFFNENLK